MFDMTLFRIEIVNSKFEEQLITYIDKHYYLIEKDNKKERIKWNYYHLKKENKNYLELNTPHKRKIVVNGEEIMFIDHLINKIRGYGKEIDNFRFR